MENAQGASCLSPRGERSKSMCSSYSQLYVVGTVKVVLDLLQGEKNLMQLAEEHDLHPNQIKNWKSIFIRKAIEFMDDKRIKKKPSDELKCN
jgi:hypothetical protein